MSAFPSSRVFQPACLLPMVSACEPVRLTPYLPTLTSPPSPPPPPFTVPFYLERQTNATVSIPIGAPLFLPFKAAARSVDGTPSMSSSVYNQLNFTADTNESDPFTPFCSSDGDLDLNSTQARTYEISPYNYAFYVQAAGRHSSGVYTVQQGSR